MFIFTSLSIFACYSTQVIDVPAQILSSLRSVCGVVRGVVQWSVSVGLNIALLCFIFCCYMVNNSEILDSYALLLIDPDMECKQKKRG